MILNTGKLCQKILAKFIGHVGNVNKQEYLLEQAKIKKEEEY